MLVGRFVCLIVLLAPSIASAGDGIDIRRGADSVVYGNCVPSLEVENNTLDIINYLQVDLALALSNGQERVVELKSAYRDGVLHPIGAGGRATLHQQLDMSRALGASCAEVKSRRVVRTICEAEDGKSCMPSVSIKP